MAFRGAGVPEEHVVRSYRVKVMSTRAKHRRATAMLVAGGDAWAFCVDRFHERIRARVELVTRKSAENLVLALSHDQPYDPEPVRCVRLCSQADELFLDLTAWVAVAPVKLSSGLVAGVDPGIIHPLAVACGDRALLVSGRAGRAEEFLHLEDSKARAKKASSKRAPLRARPGSPRQEGSRAWRKLHARQLEAESRSRRVVTLAANQAARLAANFLERTEASRVVIGDPTGVRDKDAGAVHNRRTHRWPVVHTTRALRYRLEEARIAAELTDERGTSSHCPDCGAVAQKQGRVLSCTDPACDIVHHRDIAGAAKHGPQTGPCTECDCSHRAPSGGHPCPA